MFRSRVYRIMMCSYIIGLHNSSTTGTSIMVTGATPPLAMPAVESYPVHLYQMKHWYNVTSLQVHLHQVKHCVMFPGASPTFTLISLLPFKLADLFQLFINYNCFSL